MARSATAINRRASAVTSQRAFDRLMAPPTVANLAAMDEASLETEAFIQSALVSAEIQIEAGPEFDTILYDTSIWIRKSIAKLSAASILEHMGPDSSKYSVFVDGKINVPLTGIIGGPLPKEIVARDAAASLELLQKQMKLAFDIIMNHLRQVVPSSFNPRNSTGRYQTSGFSTQFFTILQSGKEVSSINWKNINHNSNVTIYSKARHASPIESIHGGRLLAGAATAASRVKEVSVGFSYRDPVKMKQEIVYAKRTGKQFRPLAVPVIEIGSTASNVIPLIVNVSRNLSYRKETETGSQNLIYGRRILPESRKTSPSLYPKSKKRR